ncbi:MAG TPA: GNAT family N-acetyltransferase [Bacillota bacterium]|nr:GNAT family N-acetyltransferase [Bacillota bacterium]
MTNKLRLRVMEKEDLPFVHNMFNNPAIMDYWFEEAYLSYAQLQEKFSKNMDDERQRHFILDKSGERLGFVALYSIDPRHRNAEYAIMIDPDHQGNGYATPATRCAMDYAFNVLNLHKLYLYVDRENEKAMHVYKKAGFKKEAVLKEAFFVSGVYHDAVIMSVFQRDYLKVE